MLLTRAQLQQKLDALKQSMPGLVRDHQDRGDFLCAFAGHADEIADQASADDDVWASEVLDKMLRAHGFSPEDVISCDG